MSDDPNKRGKPDRSRVSQQPHEIGHLVRKHDLPGELVKKIVKQEGPLRTDVDSYLSRMKENGRKK